MVNGAINVWQGKGFFEGWQAVAAGGAAGGLTAGLAAGSGAVATFFGGGASLGAAAGTAGVGASAGRVMLEAAKQGKHIPGHNNFIQGRSIFSHPDAQGLLDKFAGTGQRISGFSGGPGKERVDFGQVIGQVNIDGVMTNTSRGIIHYSNKGAHIVPRNP